MPHNLQLYYFLAQLQTFFYGCAPFLPQLTLKRLKQKATWNIFQKANNENKIEYLNRKEWENCAKNGDKISFEFVLGH